MTPTLPWYHVLNGLTFILPLMTLTAAILLACWWMDRRNKTR